MRKLIKKTLLYFSSILHHNEKSKIVYYHDVYSNKKYTDMGTSLNMFAQHIKVIRKAGFTIKAKIENPNKEVMICFDDGFRGIYDTKQFFIDNGLRPTVFLAISLIGKPGYLNKDEILELQKEGFIFQCHAWSHSDLTEFTKEELVQELYESKKTLTEFLGKTVDEICFPIGYFSQLVLDECKRYGYNTMYSSIPGNYFDQLYADGLRTRNLLQFADANEAKLILHGGNDMIHNRYVKMHWKG
ncbi:polysaccharide deacetylase family protein [Bacteroides ovatus]|uniref:polysaccharide deacetylase family protein n=1 Tax=Bacteroides ovatus TaxID=28116 RepID=UPI00189BB87E|nr:polysaccharide deacetylase family protein [Bacteroides ovatus]MDC2625238.1 polysaccharide deacetylase family protein [Bacteroides ovatus]MDC2639128.1 polysaccharide deacetylase family protein [Bacteroides ovatus]